MNYLKIITISSLVCFLFYLAVLPFANQEAFTNQQLEYPLATNKPILYGDYKIPANMELGQSNTSDIYKDYPTFPAHSINTNNIRYWATPDNGKCSPPELCNVFYAPTKQNSQAESPPLPGWNNRANYYEYN